MKTLADYIYYLRTFTRYDCPERHYQAWKVIVIGTSEYKNPVELLEIGYKLFTEQV